MFQNYEILIIVVVVLLYSLCSFYWTTYFLVGDRESLVGDLDIDFAGDFWKFKKVELLLI